MTEIQSTRWAKLSRPRLFDALARPRLYAALDALRRHPALWLNGPPGAGKTTLAGSYLESRSAETLWYHVDGGDRDPATFFYYLGRAAAARSSDVVLPLLTPEYGPDLEGFSRRFFRLLFDALPPGSVLALDNLHEVPDDSVLHAILSWAITEIPLQTHLIAVSRSAPAPVYARAMANGQLGRFDAAELRLTPEEALAIATLRGVAVNVSDVGRLYRQCDGWAAGFTLMLERMQRSGAMPEVDESAARDAVFAYFAGEVLDKMPDTDQAVLAAVAFLPQCSAEQARAMAQRPEAPTVLDQLYRRHMFVDRRGRDEPSYHLHDLFRAFLLDRVAQTCEHQKRDGLIRRAAAILAGSGQFEDAARLWQDAREWAALSELITAQASRLMAQGRGQTLRDWIAAIPPAQFHATPWLRYWRGTSLIGIANAQARSDLEAAHSEFQGQANVRGQMQTACGIVESIFFELSGDARLDTWIVAIERLLALAPVFDARDEEIRVYANLVSALIRRKPSDPQLGRHVATLVDLLAGEAESSRKVVAAGMVLQYLHFKPDETTLQRLRVAVDPVAELPSVPAIHRIHYRIFLAFALHRYGHHEHALRLFDSALDLAEQEGFAQIAPFAVFLKHVVLLAEHHPQTRENLARFERLVAAQADVASHASCGLSWGKAAHALLSGDVGEARRWAVATVETADRVGMAFLRGRTRRTLAEALAEAGDYESSALAVREARAIAIESGFSWLEEELDLVETYALLLQGDTAGARQRLADTLARMRTAGALADHLDYSGLEIRARLYAFALTHGVEVPYVRDIIRRYRIRPYGYGGDVWPWVVRVFTLGRFTVEVGGQPLQFGRKSPRRVLDLLKVIICHGGRSVPLERVYDALWPESEADAAHEAFATTLHRLRKLLGSEGTVVLEDGKLSLNPELCWVDALALEATGQADTEKAVDGAGRELLERYLGVFLPADSDKPWTAGMRERLRRKFVADCAALGKHHEETRAFDAALHLYRRALELDDLAEAFYRGMMRCHHRLGHPAEAAAIYRRLRDRLSVTLGISPAAETRALFDQILIGTAE